MSSSLNASTLSEYLYDTAIFNSCMERIGYFSGGSCGDQPIFEACDTVSDDCDLVVNDDINIIDNTTLYVRNISVIGGGFYRYVHLEFINGRFKVVNYVR
jgi:hypothetical protein